MLMFDQPDILNSIGVQCALTGSSWDRGIGRIDAPAWDTPIETIAACGGAAFYRTDALRVVGLIDETYGIYFDDVDLNLRMWSHGYKTVTCPGARVRHKFSASFGSEAGRRRKYFLGTRNRLRMVYRNFPTNRTAEWLPRLIKGEVKALGRALLDREFWRVSAHLRAWSDTLHALPEIRRTRREWRQTNRTHQSFWHLLDRSLLFCPELVLPVQGWYPEYQGYLPMARQARREVNAGRLRISLTNCYSAKRPLTVSVALNGAPLATLVSNGDTAFEGAIQAGTLEFEAHDFLPAEETGLPYDCGGWVAIEAMAAN
jgi:hypothetical protein